MKEEIRSWTIFVFPIIMEEEGILFPEKRVEG